MKSVWKLIFLGLMICLVNYQTFSQIIEIKKGEQFPYSTGVGMTLETYRYWRLKTFKSDSLLTSKSETISLLENQLKEVKAKSSDIESKNSSLNRELISKNNTIVNSSKINNDLLIKINSLEPKKLWFKRKEVWITGLSGLLLGAFISK